MDDIVPHDADHVARAVFAFTEAKAVWAAKLKTKLVSQHHPPTWTWCGSLSPVLSVMHAVCVGAFACGLLAQISEKVKANWRSKTAG
jgi:hypothetical protein